MLTDVGAKAPVRTWQGQESRGNELAETGGNRATQGHVRPSWHRGLRHEGR